MKTRIAVAIASLFMASLGTAAYAQQTPPPPAMATTSGQSAMSNQQMEEQNESHNGMNEQQQDNMSHNGMSHNGMMSSQKMQEKIKDELQSHGVTATNVNVMFSNGTATLSGTVDTQKDIKKAKKAAMKVRGVKHVDTSGLQVQSQGGMQ